VTGDKVSSGVWWEEQVPAPDFFVKEVCKAPKSNMMHLMQG